MEENKSQATTTQTQTASTPPAEEEAKNIFAKIVGWVKNGEVPGDTSTDTDGATQAAEGDQTQATKAEGEKKSYTAEEVQAMIADEQKKWQQSQTKTATTATATKEEKKVSEAERIAKLESDLRRRDASKKLADAGYPEDLIDLLDVSNDDALNTSFERVTKVFQSSLENGIKSHLKGRTPQAASDVKVGSVESQKENARKLMGIKKK